MWQAEPPEVPTANSSVIYVMASADAAPATRSARVMGVCDKVYLDRDGGHATTGIGYKSAASSYMYHYENREMNFRDAMVAVIKRPKHGKLISGDDGVPETYSPMEGYSGNDSFVLRVTKGDVSIELRYFVLIDNRANVTHMTCKQMPKGSFGYWKISGLMPSVHT